VGQSSSRVKRSETVETFCTSTVPLCVQSKPGAFSSRPCVFPNFLRLPYASRSRCSTTSLRTVKRNFSTYMRRTELILFLTHRNLDNLNGAHILHPHQHLLLSPADAVDALFVPAHPSFRVIKIGTPVPPSSYTGYTLDPPFRSRFQAHFLDPTSALLAYCIPTLLLPTSGGIRHSLDNPT
jgi:hypothetical protein